MGRAIFELLRKSSNASNPSQFYVCSLGKISKKGVRQLKSLEELEKICDIIFLCVKPQEFYQINFTKPSVDKNPILISIMAGVNLKNIEKITGCRKIVRAMPNLPLQIGKGFTGWHANKKYFSKKELGLVKDIFSFFGKSIFVFQEEKIDAITAISGSGPAYVFLFIDALNKSAISLGFSRSQAEEIVMETVSGSVEYLRSLKKTDIGGLINKVKSKKGTTEAAFDDLNLKLFYKKWESAIKKARSRAEEISSYEIK